MLLPLCGCAHHGKKSRSVLLKDLRYSQINATIIHTDNQDCIVLAHNSITHMYTKYIDICHHFICKCVKSQGIDLWYCSTKDMIANIFLDIFTKQLPWKAFECFRNALGIKKI